MVEGQAAMDSVFHALAHGARRDMLGRLAGRAGLVERTVDGRRHVCRLQPAPLASAAEWLAFYERYWTGRLDALEELFEA
jgi:hypothetical protein